MSSGDEGTFEPPASVVEGGEALEWEVRLWEQRPESRWAILAIALTAGSYGFFILRTPLLGLLGPLVIFVSTAEMFLPVRFRLDTKGAARKCGLSTTYLEWSGVRRIIEQGDVIRVSPLASPSRLDAFRGVPLKLSGNRDAVLAKIRELWQSDERRLFGETDSGGGGEADQPDHRRNSQTPSGDAGNPAP